MTSLVLIVQVVPINFEIAHLRKKVMYIFSRNADVIRGRKGSCLNGEQFFSNILKSMSKSWLSSSDSSAKNTGSLSITSRLEIPFLVLNHERVAVFLTHVMNRFLD